MLDPCHELIAHRVSAEEWNSFVRFIPTGFRDFPAAWNLDPALKARLTLKVQWHYLNPDLVAEPHEKRARAWAFMASFLGERFGQKFAFLRNRLEPRDREKWDRRFAQFEPLLLLSSMDEALQLDWLAHFEARIRYGQARRVRVIKNKGLGFTSELLDVNVLMTWSQIKARFRFLLKKNHPDMGGSSAATQAS